MSLQESLNLGHGMHDSLNELFKQFMKTVTLFFNCSLCLRAYLLMYDLKFNKKED